MSDYLTRAGTCADCKRKREVYSISRQGGGSYNRGGRRYRSSICTECVLGRMPYVSQSANAGSTSGGFDNWTLIRLAEHIVSTGNDPVMDVNVWKYEVVDGEERPVQRTVQMTVTQMLVSYREAVARREAEHEERMRRWAAREH